ncbi:carbohydrate ABC transporter permease [Cohnella cellulosilytica]|uniref:Carbohydrate ABC transporter permease n=1 Tax=Cohnella cellulosilytica TaxID=986710 RepID=A0ABW2FM58_9BACL
MSSKASWKEMGLAYLMIFPALFFFVLYLVYPLFKSLRMSLYDYSGIGSLTDFVGLANYVEALADKQFYNAMANNFTLMAIELVVSLTVAFILAYFLYRGVFGWKFFNVVLFLPYIIPLSVSAIIWTSIYEPNIGLLNTFLDKIGLDSWKRVWLGSTDTSLYSVIAVWIWRTIPFNMLILLGAMLKIPKEMIEAARIDGCSGFRIVHYLIVPLTAPTIGLLFILSVAYDFRAFDMVWVMTQGGPADSTQIASTLVYKLGFSQNEYGYANAIAFLVFAFVAAVAGALILAAKVVNAGLNRKRGSKQ